MTDNRHVVIVSERRDPRLGRIVDHDPRSLNFLVQPRQAVVSRVWDRRVPITNQGQLGSCTGHAGIGCMGTGGFFDTMPKGMAYDKKAAESLYSDATKVDPFNGSWPPTDTGSSGLGIGKVLKSRGLIKEYRHAITFDQALAALMDGPVITGIPWTSGMMNTDANGFVTPKGSPDGGHEFCVYGVNVEEKYVYCANSWGTNWGLKGLFKMTFATWQNRLASKGDVTQFIASNIIDVPVPPTPTPVVDVNDVDFWTAAKAWAVARGIPMSQVDASMYLVVRQWATAKGLNV
jgi:hypothetical protein